jgi:hypothetical protein
MTTGTRGKDPAGITTQDPILGQGSTRWPRPPARQLPQGDDAGGADHRACLRQDHLHNLEPEDLVALTIESAAMARVPLAGTSWIPGMTGNF